MIVEAVRDGDFDEGLAYAMHFNGMLRSQDVFQARVEDFSHIGMRTVLTIGDPDKGEDVKTGVDQGVEYVAVWVVLMIRKFLRGRGNKEKVFGFSESRYNQNFLRRLAKFLSGYVRGVYVWRHSGAAEMVRE